tara:strand:+ start:186 stop:452 length:267 start_codon:yes stop_codon:yes gene_type:complete
VGDTAIKAAMANKAAMVTKVVAMEADLVTKVAVMAVVTDSVAVTVNKVVMAVKAVKLPLLRADLVVEVATALLNLAILISPHPEIMEI